MESRNGLHLAVKEGCETELPDESRYLGCPDIKLRLIGEKARRGLPEPLMAARPLGRSEKHLLGGRENGTSPYGQHSEYAARQTEKPHHRSLNRGLSK